MKSSLVRAWLYYKNVGENYEPEMGFVERNGIRQYMAELVINPRPNIQKVKQMHFTPFDVAFYTDMNGILLSR